MVVEIRLRQKSRSTDNRDNAQYDCMLRRSIRKVRRLVGSATMCYGGWYHQKEVQPKGKFTIAMLHYLYSSVDYTRVLFVCWSINGTWHAF